MLILTVGRIEIITVLDGFKYIGTMQICVSRMMQESAIFFGVRHLSPVLFHCHWLPVDSLLSYFSCSVSLE